MSLFLIEGQENEGGIALVRDGNLAYSAKRQGPAPWKDLQGADYGINPRNGQPFQRQTLPQASRLLSLVLQEKERGVRWERNSRFVVLSCYFC